MQKQQDVLSFAEQTRLSQKLKVVIKKVKTDTDAFQCYILI